MSIEKAVVPVGGLGTRLLPATKSQPKEMLPVGRKPAVQYVVEELAQQGIRDILFVTGWKKRAIEDHFDDSPELVKRLTGQDKKELLHALDYGVDHLSFYYTRQKDPRGLGDAVRYAERFVNNEPFVVALGDAILRDSGTSNLVQQLIEVHQRHRCSATIAVAEVGPEELGLYGVVKPKFTTDLSSGDFEMDDVVEKPSPADAPSPYAIAARYVFSPIIFRAIDQTTVIHGEVGLSHAIRVLIGMGEPVRCVKLAKNEKRYDIGNHESYFRAFVDFALRDEEYGPALRAYLKEELARLDGQA